MVIWEYLLKNLRILQIWDLEGRQTFREVLQFSPQKLVFRNTQLDSIVGNNRNLVGMITLICLGATKMWSSRKVE
jgi:hypothetical protein